MNAVHLGGGRGGGGGTKAAPAEYGQLDQQNAQLLYEFLKGLRNDTIDFQKPHIRLSLEDCYKVIAGVYIFLSVAGALCSALMLIKLVRRRGAADPLDGLLANLALSDLVKCLLVLPISLVVLLVHNWIFGSTLCYLLPMIQDMPLHVTTLTLVAMAVDRHRKLVQPTRKRFSSATCALATWLAALLVVVPYPIYTTYLDLGSLLQNSRFDGVGICAVNFAHNMQEYTRGLFVAMYVVPMSVVTFLHVRVHRELRRLDAAPQPPPPPPPAIRKPNGHAQLGSSTSTAAATTANANNNNDDNNRAERRTQKYVVMMTAAVAICLAPLAILRMAQLVLMETYATAATFDLTFVVVVWLAFLPSCLTPLIFALWSSSNP